ncbi:hypothetical protein EYF80_015712 [Liparis tanakae]|uniref:Uncharacterized protein n=1 Tax=Liparis tanakae TaxID=230148 RepID=A0A4Z2I8C7_9TELE|nr:hypothetical protein EYF80_015712 [Liparis tanakae]
MCQAEVVEHNTPEYTLKCNMFLFQRLFCLLKGHVMDSRTSEAVAQQDTGVTNCDSCESLTSGGEAFHKSCVYDRDSLAKFHVEHSTGGLPSGSESSN